MMTLPRRRFLTLGASALLLPGIAGAAGPTPSPGCFVWINLRGGLDGLHAVLPTGDPGLLRLREPLLAPLADTLLALDGDFALHPELKTLHAWYREKCFAPVVAVASPYRERSHFAAQDVLESGLQPADTGSGWLARALLARQLAGREALAVGRSVPLALRGGEQARSWYPSTLPAADEDLYQRLLALYEGDPLQARLEEGLGTRRSLGAEGASPGPGRPRFPALAQACGDILAREPALAGAVLELGGWDTHNQQLSRLRMQFRELDAGLAALRTALGARWQHTVLVVCTEFGRTAAVNGTGGTDHGTASTMFLAGGGIEGGRVLGDWPGLGERELLEKRDLRPTSDLRGWIAAALRRQWGLDDAMLSRVFPGIKTARELQSS